MITIKAKHEQMTKQKQIDKKLEANKSQEFWLNSKHI